MAERTVNKILSRLSAANNLNVYGIFLVGVNNHLVSPLVGIMRLLTTI